MSVSATGISWRSLRGAARSGYLLFQRELVNAGQTSQVGWVWELITPIAIAGVFIALFQMRALDFSVGDMPYEAFVVTGVLSWQVFTLSFNRGLNMLALHRVLSSHINVNPDVFVFSGLFYCGWVAIARIFVIVVLFALLWGIDWIGIFSFTGYTLVLAILGYIIGMCLAPIRMIYSDVEHATRILLQVLFYVSGTVFPLPERLASFAQSNPMLVLITAGRRALSGAALEQYASVSAIVCLATVLGAGVSWYVFATGTRYLRGS